MKPTLIAVTTALLSLATTTRTEAQTPNQPFGTIHESVPEAFQNVRVLAVGDLDGDGDADVIAARAGGDRVWLNDGLGVFVDAGDAAWPNANGEPTDAALGDFDGDGDLDVLVTELGGPLRGYENDGSANFLDRTPTWFGSSPAFPSSLAVGDVDGDSDLDVLVGHGAGLPDQLYLNDGNAVFTNVTATHLPPDTAVTFGVLLGDVDGDNDLDAVLGNLSGRTRLYRNDGTGQFTDVTTTEMPTDAGISRGLAFADIDGDSDLDLVLAEAGQDACFVNDGTGRFTDETATRLPARADATVRVAFEDFDLDGDQDLLLLQSGATSLLLRNDGTGTFSDVVDALPPEPEASLLDLCVADLDGDGDADVLAANVIGTSQQWLNDGTAHFVDAVTSVLDTPIRLELFDLALEDFDGDGLRDMFIAAGHPFALQPNLVLIQSPDGRFVDVSATALPSSFAASQAVAAGDLDGDGDIDLMVGNAGMQQNQLLLNDSTGVFVDSTATGLPALADETYEIVFGDVDGDGDLDAWIGNWMAPDSLLINDGSGVFTDQSSNIPSLNGATTTVALGDVDGDNDLDALVALSGMQNRLYLNDGSGVFTDATAGRLPSQNDGSMDLALGDLDSDGDLDAWVANLVSPDVVLINDGTGTFTAVAPPAIGIDSGAVAIEDVDGDSDLDVVVNIRGGGSVVCFNDGSANFTVSLPIPDPTFITVERIALADMDGDLDPDLVTVPPISFRRNETRELEWRGLPRIGKPLRFDLRGPTLGLWMLGASVSDGFVPTAFGVFRLDGAGFLGTFGGLLDAQGLATPTFAVPALPSLVGTTIYWQGLVGGVDMALTNLELTTLTGA